LRFSSFNLNLITIKNNEILEQISYCLWTRRDSNPRPEKRQIIQSLTGLASYRVALLFAPPAALIYAANLLKIRLKLALR